MKASQLIELLQSAVKRHGDLEVRAHTCIADYDINYETEAVVSDVVRENQYDDRGVFIMLKTDSTL